ncbi:MAG: pentapeptide repeat-containing protein [Porphyromonas sp.]|nr:pentapeptide repeat-containing protein [Porphyromonas sp.]
MRKITQEELIKILDKHTRWLNNEEGGKRADFREADLRGVDLQGADMPNSIYQVVGCGIVNRCTTYDAINDQVICGCWDDDNGNHLDSFKQRIEAIYGKGGRKPNAKHYAQYQAAIAFFEAMKKAEEL